MAKLYRNINAMIVPTGIGAQIGGFAGDATPAAKLLAKASDILITHPNVINAALLTDIPKNVIVLEGYLMDRFFANQILLRPNVKHKIALVMDVSASDTDKDITQNCLNAAKNVYGLDIVDDIFYTEKPVGATLDSLPDPEDPKALEKYKNGQGLDPIGQIEAKISHLVSRQFLIPSAHAPVFDTPYEHEGVVAGKVAAEHLGNTYLASVFKCLQYSPRIIPSAAALKLLVSDYTDPADLNLKASGEDIKVGDLANLVVPYDCCNAVPMIEANNYEIELLTVLNNQTTLDDPADFYAIPHTVVNNYLEAAGYLLANTKDQDYINPNLFH